MRVHVRALQVVSLLVKMAVHWSIWVQLLFLTPNSSFLPRQTLGGSDDGFSNWISNDFMGDPDYVPSFDLSLSCAWYTSGEETRIGVLSLACSLSHCVSAFQIN